MDRVPLHHTTASYQSCYLNLEARAVFRIGTRSRIRAAVDFACELGGVRGFCPFFHFSRMTLLAVTGGDTDIGTRIDLDRIHRTSARVVRGDHIHFVDAREVGCEFGCRCGRIFQRGFGAAMTGRIQCDVFVTLRKIFLSS